MEDAVSGDIQSTVTLLLHHTKQLLESLNLWSIGKATEKDVSDIYVKLGNVFNLACRKFLSAGIDVADLGDVPFMLRKVLEQALAEDASKEVLEIYLPQIREIIVGLLRQLKHKQAYMAQTLNRQYKMQQQQFQQQQSSQPQFVSHMQDSIPSYQQPQAQAHPQPQVQSQPQPQAQAQAQPQPQPHHQSFDSNQQHTVRSIPSRQRSSHSANDSIDGSSVKSSVTVQASTTTVPSQPQTRGAPTSAAAALMYPRKHRTTSNSSNESASQSERSMPFSGVPSQTTDSSPASSVAQQNSSNPNSANSATYQLNPGIIEPNPTPSNYRSRQSSEILVNKRGTPHVSSPGPPSAGNSPIVDNSAGSLMHKLQRSRALERAASKRYSSHHLTQMMNDTMSQPTVLPTKNSHAGPRPADMIETHTIKDDVPEHRRWNRSLSRDMRDGIPANPSIDESTAEVDDEPTPKISALSPPATVEHPGSDRQTSPFLDPVPRSPQSSGNSQSSSLVSAQSEISEEPGKPDSGESTRNGAGKANSVTATPTVGPTAEETNIAIFLKFGEKIRKAKICTPPSLAAVRLQFVDMFEYMPSGDETFPDMLIKDPKSGIDYELTNATVSDINEGTLLTLNLPDTNRDTVSSQLASLHLAVNELAAKITTPTSSGVNTTTGKLAKGPVSRSGSGSGSKSTSPAIGSSTLYKNIAGASAPGKASPLVDSKNESNFSTSSDQSGNTTPAIQFGARKLASDQVELVKRELAVVRQISNKAISDMRKSVEHLSRQLSEIRSSSASASRSYMTQTKAKLDEDCTSLLTFVDELQDDIDAYRVMVANRGIKVHPKKLETAAKDLESAKDRLESLSSYVSDEEPTWRKTWETELNIVLEEQNWVKLQKAILDDLHSDLNQAQGTFQLLKECSDSLPTKAAGTGRLLQIQPIPPGQEQEVTSALLKDIVALKPNNSQRLEAAKRTERMRERELAMRSNEFEDELGSFVGDQRLKKTGGIEEVERRRKERDAMTSELQKKYDAEGEEQKKLLREERRRKKREANGADNGTDNGAGDAEPNDASSKNLAENPTGDPTKLSLGAKTHEGDVDSYREEVEDKANAEASSQLEAAL